MVRMNACMLSEGMPPVLLHDTFIKKHISPWWLSLKFVKNWHLGTSYHLKHNWRKAEEHPCPRLRGFLLLPRVSIREPLPPDCGESCAGPPPARLPGGPLHPVHQELQDVQRLSQAQRALPPQQGWLRVQIHHDTRTH